MLLSLQRHSIPVACWSEGVREWRKGKIYRPVTQTRNATICHLDARQTARMNGPPAAGSASLVPIGPVWFRSIAPRHTDLLSVTICWAASFAIDPGTFRPVQPQQHQERRQNRCSVVSTGRASLSRSGWNFWGYAGRPAISHFLEHTLNCGKSWN